MSIFSLSGSRAQQAGVSTELPQESCAWGSVLPGPAEHPGPRDGECSASLSSLQAAGFCAKEFLRGMCFQPSSGEGQVAMTKAFETKRCGMEK